MRKERLKKLVSFYKPYKTVFFLDLLCSLVKAGIALVLPLGVGYITGALLVRGGPGVLGQVLWVGGRAAGAGARPGPVQLLLRLPGPLPGAKIERDMRAEMFRHCQGLSFSYYDSHTVGDLMSRITNDSLALAEFFHHVPEDLVVNVNKFFGAAAILLWAQLAHRPGDSAFLPFMTWYTLHFNKKMAAALALGRERIGAVNAQTEGLPLGHPGGADLRQRAGGGGQIRRAEPALLRGPPPGLPGGGPVLGRHGGLRQPHPHRRGHRRQHRDSEGSMPLSELVVFLMYVSFLHRAHPKPGEHQPPHPGGAHRLCPVHRADGDQAGRSPMPPARRSCPGPRASWSSGTWASATRTGRPCSGT